MSSKAGTLTTAILSAPLGALAMMAVVGVPQFAPGKGRTQEDALREQPFFTSDDSPEDRRESLFEELQENADDAPRWEDSPETAFQRRAPREDLPHQEGSPRDDARLGEAGAWDGTAVPVSRHAREQGDAGLDHTDSRPLERESYDDRSSLARTETDRGAGAGRSGWAAAQRRLMELGVDNYHLERGSTDGTFLFVCMFSPGDDPRIVQRFEAEEADPLDAVSSVIRQLDEWMQRRFVDSDSSGFRGGR